MYKIEADAARNLVEVTLSGMLNPDEVRTYITDLRHAMAVNRIHAGYRLVIDVTTCTIQTQDMIQTMGEQMKAMPKAGAIAIVSASQLARMQIRRLFQQDYARIVQNVEEGRAWVLERQEPSAEPLTPDRPATV